MQTTLTTGSGANRQRLTADGLLLLVAVIWGSAFVAQRLIAVSGLGFFLFNGLRFLVGTAVTFLFLRGNLYGFTRTELRGGALAGVIILSAATLQHAGMRWTTAGKAGFITGLYVVLIPLFLTIFWRRKLSTVTWMASGLAAAGLFLLSVQEDLTLAPGDGLEMIGAVMWTLHVILIGRLAPKCDALRLAIVQYATCGVLGTLIGLIFEGGTLGELPPAWLAILYTGGLSVGVGYTLQVMGQRHAPPADSAILLSLEAVFAALFGWWILGEALTPPQLLGCGLMMAGMLLAQWGVLAPQHQVKDAAAMDNRADENAAP